MLLRRAGEIKIIEIAYEQGFPSGKNHAEGESHQKELIEIFEEQLSKKDNGGAHEQDPRKKHFGMRFIVEVQVFEGENDEKRIDGQHGCNGNHVLFDRTLN